MNDDCLDGPLENALLIGLSQRTRFLTTILSSGRIPEGGLPVASIRELLVSLAGLDMNNRAAASFDVPSSTLAVKRTIGAGEREGRIASSLVSELHLGFAHGVGRSGSLTERQPKAAGSSLLARFANSLALDAVKQIGISAVAAALVVPMATGMALSLCLGAWRCLKPSATTVVYLRVDQRSGFKSIFFPGLQPVVIDCRTERSDNSLTTDLLSLENFLEENSSTVLAVLSTTSCFAPRAPDDLCAVGELCAQYSVFHLVNNAYGLQSKECRRRICEAGAAGHIDAFVQSLDKNFLVPVGGALVCTFDRAELDRIAAFYPGRASMVPSRDLVITLLELGGSGLRALYRAQESTFEYLREKLSEFAESIAQRVFHVPTNLVSLAMSLGGYFPEEQMLFGSLLFARGVSGARVICPTGVRDVEGYSFTNYGSHYSSDFEGYLNVACSIGMTTAEVDDLLERLRATFVAFTKELDRSYKRSASEL